MADGGFSCARAELATATLRNSMDCTGVPLCTNVTCSNLENTPCHASTHNQRPDRKNSEARRQYWTCILFERPQRTTISREWQKAIFVWDEMSLSANSAIAVMNKLCYIHFFFKIVRDERCTTFRRDVIWQGLTSQKKKCPLHFDLEDWISEKPKKTQILQPVSLNHPGLKLCRFTRGCEMEYCNRSYLIREISLLSSLMKQKD